MIQRRHLLMAGLALACVAVISAQTPLPYVVVGTGQTVTYDNVRAIAPPAAGQPFYGQDAQAPAAKPTYRVATDGLTVADVNTGLTWQRSPDTTGDGVLTAAHKLTYSKAVARPAALNAARFGGFSDWRLPSIKELYSLILFSGVDPSGPEMNAKGLTPFIDAKAFAFAYGDEAAGERVIDSQYVSSTKYVGPSARNQGKVFGVNFADGRIKGYELAAPGGTGEKTFFVICVRGNPKYGLNDFADNTDGTVTDRATGLTWAKADSGKGMNWEQAFAWAQARNAEKYLGHTDWRVPNAKELQSLVDYTRSPETTASAALDPVFEVTRITNEAGQPDYPFYWTSTTHASRQAGASAVYVAFGRAAGWMSGMPGRGGPGARQGRGGPPEDGRGATGAAAQFVDVHGAGAQRSDPKAGDAKAFPRGRGPQGDVIRIDNFVRLVRGGGK